MSLSARTTTRLMATLSTFSALFVAGNGQAQGEFKDVEIRVIRNKYFQKSLRLELAGNFSAIMNKPFIYTYLGGGQVGFHLNEQFGIYAEGAYGFTLNKSDCKTLGEKFAIEPIVYLMDYYLSGSLAYTPIYGKYQLSNGDVTYFDWYLSAGAGIAGARPRQNSCNPEESSPDQPTKSVPMFQVGTGQRYFIDKNTVFNWNLRYIGYSKSQLGDSGIEPNVLLSLGVSYFL